MDKNFSLNKETLKFLSNLSLAAGFLSIAVSLISWFSKGGRNRDHAERLAIFVGLWVPSLFALSHRLARAAEERDWGDGLGQEKGIRKLASDFLEEVGGVPSRS
jgi:hypothetical protein